MDRTDKHGYLLTGGIIAAGFLKQELIRWGGTEL